MGRPATTDVMRLRPARQGRRGPSLEDPVFYCEDYQPPPPWLGNGACVGTFLPVFFPDRGNTTAADQARRICAPCPVWEECLIYATWDRYTREGIWGGTAGDERVQLRQGRITVADIRRRLDSLLEQHHKPATLLALTRKVE